MINAISYGLEKLGVSRIGEKMKMGAAASDFEHSFIYDECFFVDLQAGNYTGDQIIQSIREFYEGLGYVYICERGDLADEEADEAKQIVFGNEEGPLTVTLFYRGLQELETKLEISVERCEI